MKNYIFRYSKYPHRSDKRDFYYLDANLKKINKLPTKLVARIADMKLPPAYHPVKISLNANSKIQAIGTDQKGKSQYIYNSCWVNKRERKKICQLNDFSKQLPTIRNKIDRHLRSSSMSQDKIIALILKIILGCHFRVGNDIGRDVYNSYGITTITKKQLKTTSKGGLEIEFIGKRGVTNKCLIRDSVVKKLLKELSSQRRLGEQLFTYHDPKTKESKRINAKDVNGFLKEFGEFTSKYFRTWIANVEFIDEIMKRYGDLSNQKKKQLSTTARKKLLRESVVATAEKLYHTPAICKKSYVDDELWDLFLDTPGKFDNLIVKNYKNTKGLDASENAFSHFLRHKCRK